MNNQSTFENIKSDILRRAKKAHACTEQYSRAYKAVDMAQLCTVIKDNFWWACCNQVLTVELLELYKSEFAEHEIYVNVSVERGFLLCSNASVEAYDNASVVACHNASVKAYHNASVKAYDNAYCTSYSTIECKLSDNAIYRKQSTNTIYYASDEIKFVKQ